MNVQEANHKFSNFFTQVNSIFPDFAHLPEILRVLSDDFARREAELVALEDTKRSLGAEVQKLSDQRDEAKQLVAVRLKAEEAKQRADLSARLSSVKASLADIEARLDAATISHEAVSKQLQEKQDVLAKLKS